MCPPKENQVKDNRQKGGGALHGFRYYGYTHSPVAHQRTDIARAAVTYIHIYIAERFGF